MTSVEYGYITSPDIYMWKDEEEEIPAAAYPSGYTFISPFDPTPEQIELIREYAKTHGFGVVVKEISDPIVKVPFPIPEPTVVGALVETEQGFRFIRTERVDNPWLRVNRYNDQAHPNFLSWKNIDTPVRVNLPTDKA